MPKRKGYSRSSSSRGRRKLIIHGRGQVVKYTPRDRNAASRGFLNLEKKFKDKAFTDTDVSDGGQVFGPLCAASQGSGDSERVGRKQFIHGLFIQGFVKLGPSQISADAQNWVKIMLVQDNQTNGAAMTIAQFLAAPDINAYRNLENSQRFKVLLTRWVQIRPTASITAGVDGASSLYADTTERFSMAYNFKDPVTLTFNDTGAVIGDMNTTSFHLVTIAEHNPTTGSFTTMDFRVRTRYTD